MAAKAAIFGVIVAGALALAVICAPAPASAADVEIEVAVDQSEITVGDPVAYSITLTWDPAVQPADPVLEENLGALVVRDRKRGELQTLEDGRQQRTDIYTITSYTVGEYKIPPPLVRYQPKEGEARTIAAEPVALKVKSIAPEDATDIRDIKPPVSVPRDLRKPGMIAAGALAALVLVIALIVWLVRRSRRGGAPVPQEPPYDRAIRRLRVLRNAPRATHDDIKAFSVELSEILRDYLDGRFAVPAPLLTTSQLRRFIGDLDAPPPDHETWLRVLDSADFVKFARVEPSPEDLDKDYETVRSFVDKTRPTPDPEKKDVPKEEAA